MKTKINIIYSLYGKFDPNEIYKRIGINEAIYYKEGDSIPTAKKMKSKCDVWDLRTGHTITLYMSKELDKIYELIEPKKEIIKLIINEYNLESQFEIVVHIDNNNTPEMHFTKKILDLAYYLGSEIDIDLYT